MNIASAHNIPLCGHSCKAFDSIGKAISLLPARISTRTASSHKRSFFGFFKRPFSSTERALIRAPSDSSSRANNIHNATFELFDLSPPLAHSKASELARFSASSSQPCSRSSSSIPKSITDLTIACAVAFEPDFSVSIASCTQCSRLISTPLACNEFSARSIIFCTIDKLPCASSSLAAVNHICLSVGIFSRALFNTFRAFSYTSNRANANHRSTLVGQHSTALVRRIRASSGSSNSTASFHNRTEFGICSNALRKIFFFAFTSFSNSAAFIQRRTDEFPSFRTPCAMTDLARSGG
ncbi:hypothetical protein DERF_008008 [Dermatophagoides farinae]|uniref:Uncharacterized protein n=1 Tax=Dermatophagoides farinae TaxID=6954 RepID=A0A922L521_DERFA|nr:hypothetical protein DERF_008008 [Dermatophagoides farinae]